MPGKPRWWKLVAIVPGKRALPAKVSGQMAATGSDTVLELDRLSVAYDRAPVVRDLTLTVGRGEVVALLGANGAGKTTTLRTISGLGKPMEGFIRLGGEDLAGVSPTARVRRGIVHVPQGRQRKWRRHMPRLGCRR